MSHPVPTRFWLGIVLLMPLLASCLSAPPPFDEEDWQRRVAHQDPAQLYVSHHENGVFFNPWMQEDEGRFGQFIRWRLTRRPDYSADEESYLPAVEPDLLERLELVGDNEDLLVWIGHGTFLLRLSGSYWLTDPILSERALLPRRFTPPALSLEELGKLEAPLTVLISHNHYDHLDKQTLVALPAHARLIVPLGLGALVSSYHAGEVVEIDWWQQVERGQGLVTALPAQHWSRRIGQGRNTTLWVSYMIESPRLRIYFGGDSGYFVGYREFGRKFKPIDYALLPLTAYQPRWFMHPAHLNVDEALRAFDQLQAEWFVPTQWGTFRLGDNPPGYPLLDLKRTLESREIDPRPYLTPDLGQIIKLAAPSSDP